MALLDAIASHLETQGVADGSTTWTIYKSYLPEDAPATVLAIFETAGRPIDATPGTNYEYPSFQLQVRGAEFGYEAARTKMQEAVLALHDQSITGHIFCYARHSPLLLGYDANNRPTIVCNFDTMLELA